MTLSLGFSVFLHSCRYFFFTDISNGNVPSLGARYHERIHNRYVRQIRYIPRMRCWLSCAKDTATAFLPSDLVHEMVARPQFWTVEHGVNAFDYSEKLNVIVTGGFDTVIRLWNPLAEESKLVGFLKGHISPVTHLMVNYSHETLVSLAENKDILVFDLNTTTCIQTLLRKALRPMGIRPFSAAMLHQSINRVVMATKSLAIITSRTDETSKLLTAGKDRLITSMLYNSLFKQVGCNSISYVINANPKRQCSRHRSFLIIPLAPSTHEYVGRESDPYPHQPS